MAAGLQGTWNSVRFENMEPLMEHHTFPLESANSVQVKIEKKSNSYRIVSTIGSKVRDVTFPLGQEVDTVNLLNQPVKVVLTEDNGSLREVQRTPGKANATTIVRSLDAGGNMVTSMTDPEESTGKVFFTKAN